MIINFTKEERFQIIELLEKYHKINHDYDTYLKQVQELQEKLKKEEIKLEETKKEEDLLMKSLKEKYGEFTLMDINDSLNV